MKNIGVHHYLSKYRDENNDLIVNSWIQIDFLKWHWCFSVKELRIKAEPVLEKETVYVIPAISETRFKKILKELKNED